MTAANTYTKIYLCFFGQYEWDAVPAVPPEIVLFPSWFWFNIYEISSWSRAIFIPFGNRVRDEAIQKRSLPGRWALTNCSSEDARILAYTCTGITRRGS